MHTPEIPRSQELIHAVEIPHYLCVRRLGELELKAVVFEALDLLVVPIVCDADNGHSRRLDHLNQLCHASTIACGHAVHLVHHEAGSIALLELTIVPILLLATDMA